MPVKKKFDVLDESVKLVNYIDEERRPHKLHEKDSIEEVFSYIRACVKYLLFERDALKRELEYYKGLLKGKD